MVCDKSGPLTVRNSDNGGPRGGGAIRTWSPFALSTTVRLRFDRRDSASSGDNDDDDDDGSGLPNFEAGQDYD